MQPEPAGASESERWGGGGRGREKGRRGRVNKTPECSVTPLLLESDVESAVQPAHPIAAGTVSQDAHQQRTLHSSHLCCSGVLSRTWPCQSLSSSRRQSNVHCAGRSISVAFAHQRSSCHCWLYFLLKNSVFTFHIISSSHYYFKY